MLARAYRIVHASVDETVTQLEIERLYVQLLDKDENPYQNGHKAYTNTSLTKKLLRNLMTKLSSRQVSSKRSKIEFLSQGAKSGSESHIHEYVEKLLLINQEPKDSCFEMPEKLLCFHVLHNVAKFNQHFVSSYKGRSMRVTRRGRTRSRRSGRSSALQSEQMASRKTS